MGVFRLMQNQGILLEGSCISEKKYKSVYYIEKCLYEFISDEERRDWIEVEERNYCEANGLECVLFYSKLEVETFLQKLINVKYLN